MSNSNNICGDVALPSSPNDIKILLLKLKEELAELIKTTEADLLLQNGKIAEACIYLKNNLSNSIRCLLADMEASGELEKIITDTVLNDVSVLKDKTNGIVNVKEFGAKGDGIKDDTEAFRKALKCGKTVIVPDGTYYISEMIDVEWGKSLIGSETGTTIKVDGNSFINLTGRNVVKNFKIENTVNTKESVIVTKTESYIKGSLSYSKIENINIGLAYIGIDVIVQGRSTIRDIFGCPLKYGIKIDDSVDVTFIDNVHFNQNYFGDVSVVIKNFMFENAYALYIGRADWGNASNVFCLGYKGLVYINSGSKIGGAASNFVFDNWGCDGCKSLFYCKNYSGGFKFVNGNGTFFNFFKEEIKAAGLTPSDAEPYPISLALGYVGNYEEPVMSFIGNRFFRSDNNLVLCNYNTNIIFKNNSISNMHQLQNVDSTPSTIYLGAGSRCIIEGNIFTNRGNNKNVIGIVNTQKNPNNIISNNLFVGYGNSVQEPNETTTNNKIISE